MNDVDLRLNQPNALLGSVKPQNLLPNVRGLKIASFNINSLLKHKDELRVCMFNQQLDILAINETKLDSNVPPNLIFLEGIDLVVALVSI